MIRPIQKVRGAILVMAAFILVILIGIAAFALDIGRLYVLHTEMQNAVDAAALSAVVELNGESDAIDRAKAAANQEMLNHLSHFSKKHELLENLQAKPNVYTFYTWIGSKYDSADHPSDCAPVGGKCITTSADEARYVQIQLDPDPAIFGADDGRYEIDLYFLPVLSLFGIDTASTASTKVAALAGTHYEICDYPPMIVCDPSEGGPALEPGDMILLKEHKGGGTFEPGTFGWLMPGYSKEDPDDDDLHLNSPELFTRRLGAKYPLDCSEPKVTIKTGNISNLTQIALNTRFGIYPKNFKYTKSDFPSAPNVVDYPRDDNLTNASCDKAENRFGNGIWAVTECDDRPSTFMNETYRNDYHVGNVPPYYATRFEYYNWELSGMANLGKYTGTSIEVQCNDAGEPNGCRMLDGSPFIGEIDTTNEFKRRELFVAAVACVANDIGAHNPVIYMEETDSKWMRFLISEHIGDPSEGVDVYAEFIEEVTDRQDEHFRKVVQLYE